MIAYEYQMSLLTYRSSAPEIHHFLLGPDVDVQSPCPVLQRLQFSFKVFHLKNHHKC